MVNVQHIQSLKEERSRLVKLVSASPGLSFKVGSLPRRMFSI